MNRTIKIAVPAQGTVTLTEDEATDESWLVVEASDESSTKSSFVKLTATQLFAFAADILGWFGAIALTMDQQHGRRDKLKEKISNILEVHQARCMDDDIDRNVVVAELLKGLDNGLLVSHDPTTQRLMATDVAFPFPKVTSEHVQTGADSCSCGELWPCHTLHDTPSRTFGTPQVTSARVWTEHDEIRLQRMVDTAEKLRADCDREPKTNKPGAHLAYVKADAVSFDRGGSTRKAACCCGWQGPERGSLELAVDDALLHEKSLYQVTRKATKATRKASKSTRKSARKTRKPSVSKPRKGRSGRTSTKRA